MPLAIPQNVQDMMVSAVEKKAKVDQAAARKQAAVQALIAATAEDDHATDELAQATAELHAARRAARALGFSLLETVMPTAGFGSSPAMTPSTPNGAKK